MAEEVKTADELSQQQKSISISEFFEKNRHLLGYDNKLKALLIIVKEAVDNSLDATEEARILPDIYVKLEELDKEKYRVVIKDNGPGITKSHIPKVFGSLLYGSKFHKLKQSRGQQGIGVSGAVLYSQLTTGEPTEVVSSTGDGKLHRYKLKIDVKKNEAIILEEDTVENKNNWTGVQITFVCEGIYREHKQSVLEYIKETAISNPFAHIIFDAPTGRMEFHRSVDKLPDEPKEIQPHLYGVEIGLFSRMMHETASRTISTFLQTEFSRVGKLTADEICKKSEVDPQTSPRKITDEQVVKIVKVIKETKLTRPPTDCLSPLGENLITSGLKKELAPEFVTAVTRPPSVYRGWPFQVEVGIAYGGSLKEPSIMRVANRVPLLYQAGDCAITKSIMGIEWKRYGIDADKLPTGPVSIFVHVFSVWVPFTSESKEAVASYPMIIKEVKLALQEAARKMQLYIGKKFRSAEAAKKKEMFRNYSVELAASLSALTGKKKEEIFKMLTDLAEEMYATGEIEGDTSEEEAETDEDKKPKAKKEEESEEE